MSWRPDQYLLFEEERTRPCRDLTAQIAIESPREVIDLGCGPGNSTAVLAARWPAARITGLDSSAEMLSRAGQSNSRCDWVRGDIAPWSREAGGKYDIVFSNAALQWVDDHASVYAGLLARVKDGGVLAVQTPADIEAPAHRIMREVASSRLWRARFPAGGVREWFVHKPGYYYDLLAPAASRVQLWETTYFHVLPNVEAIAEWYRGTGLRPFLGALGSEADRESFVKDYVTALRGAFHAQTNGDVLFPFRRLFLIATK